MLRRGPRLVGDDSRCDRPREEVADLAPVPVDRRDEDVRGPVSVELQDQLGEIGLDGPNASRGEQVVQVDLVRRERLHLDHLVDPVVGRDARHDLAGVRSVASPVNVPAGGGDRLLELHEVLVEPRQHVSLDRAARLAQVVPIGQFGDDTRPFRLNRVGGRPQVRAQLDVGELVLCLLGERTDAHPGRPVDARISAR